MNQDVSPRAGDRVGVRTPAGRLAVLLAGLLLAGCADQQGFWNRGTAAAPAAPVAPMDPLVAFAMQAEPGAQTRLTMADGQPASVRLVRNYAAASGRECRELLVGAGMTQRDQLVCRTDAGNWELARPLLRGASAVRR